MKKKTIAVAMVMFVVGFMIAVKFQSEKQPAETRDTRDMLELRQDLKEEQKNRAELYEQIQRNEDLIRQYQSERADDVEKTMKNAVEELKKRAGLTEISGEGIILEITAEHEYRTSTNDNVSPELLRFLINELNLYGAQEISIGNQRIISNSAFREVSGHTHVNGRRLPPLPIEVRVIADDGQQLHNEMVVSQSVEYFELENLHLTSQPEEHITLPSYNQTPRIRFMETVKEET